MAVNNAVARADKRGRACLMGNYRSAPRRCSATAGQQSHGARERECEPRLWNLRASQSCLTSEYVYMRRDDLIVSSQRVQIVVTNPERLQEDVPVYCPGCRQGRISGAGVACVTNGTHY